MSEFTNTRAPSVGDVVSYTNVHRGELAKGTISRFIPGTERDETSGCIAEITLENGLSDLIWADELTVVAYADAVRHEEVVDPRLALVQQMITSVILASHPALYQVFLTLPADHQSTVLNQFDHVIQEATSKIHTIYTKNEE